MSRGPVLLLLVLFGCGPALVGEAPLSISTAVSAPGTLAADRRFDGVRARQLTAVRGGVVVATAEGLRLGEEEALEGLTDLPDASATEPAGEVAALTARVAGGALVAAQHGLFHTHAGALYRSPLADSLGEEPVRTLDAFGEAGREELWLTTAAGARFVGDGVLLEIALDGAAAPADAAMAIGFRRGLVLARGELFDVDLIRKTVTRIATGLGAARGFARDGLGSAYLATRAGLLQRTREGALTLHTFAAPGVPRPEISAVAASGGAVMALVADQLLELRPDGSSVSRGEVDAPVGLAVDHRGFAWVVDGETLRRFDTGDAVSFEREARPFFTQRCASCHRSGTAGSPTIDFEQFEVASTYAHAALRRLKAKEGTPMPPSVDGALAPADYEVITRWVAGGLRP